MTLFMLSAIAIRPFSGLIIEKFGVKKTLYVSEIMFCLCSVAYIFVDSLMFLLVLRFFTWDLVQHCHHSYRPYCQ